MKNTVKILILMFLVASVCKTNQISAQSSNVVIDSRYKVLGRGVKNEDVPIVTQRAQQLLDNYTSALKMFDFEKGGVTSRSIDKFNNLFNLGALVLNEMEDTPEMVYATDFSTLVYEYFSNTGFDCVITSARLNKISFDSAGYYLVNIAIEKQVSSRLKGGRGIKSGKPRCFGEIMLIDVPINSDKAKIQRVEGNLRPDCPGEVTPKGFSIGIDALLGLPLLKYSQRDVADFTDNTLVYGKMIINPEKNIGIGIRLAYPVNADGSLELYLRASYVKTGMAAYFDTLRFEYDTIDIDGDKYGHESRLSDIGEELTQTVLHISPGLSLRLYDSDRWSVYLDAGGILRSVNTSGILTGNSSYSGSFTQWDWFVYAQAFDKDYGFWKYSVKDVGVLYNRKLQAGFRISPSFRLKSSDSIDWVAGVEYEYYFGEFVETAGMGSHILRYRDWGKYNNGGLVRNYAQNLKVANLNFRLGVNLKIN
jgi:hypothetical protein